MMPDTNNFKDYYKILHVRPSATLNEIKIAYRALVRKNHPDLNPDPSAEEDTKLLNEAYSVLSIPLRRKSYDQIYYQHQQNTQMVRKIEILTTIDLKKAYYGGNHRIITKEFEFDIEIPPGVEVGEIIYTQLNHYELLVTIDINPLDFIRRENQDIYLDHPVSLYTAVLGGNILVKFFDEELVINVPPGTSADQPLRIRNKGFPSFDEQDQRGNLYIRLLIRVPQNISLQEKRLFEQLLDLSESNGV